jgi:hypothetical protein
VGREASKGKLQIEILDVVWSWEPPADLHGKLGTSIAGSRQAGRLANDDKNIKNE